LCGILCGIFWISHSRTEVSGRLLVVAERCCAGWRGRDDRANSQMPSAIGVAVRRVAVLEGVSTSVGINKNAASPKAYHEGPWRSNVASATHFLFSDSKWGSFAASFCNQIQKLRRQRPTSCSQIQNGDRSRLLFVTRFNRLWRQRPTSCSQIQNGDRSRLLFVTRFKSSGVSDPLPVLRFKMGIVRGFFL